MTSQSLKLETRINTLKAVLTTKKHQEAVDEALKTANGEWLAALKSLKEQLPESSLKKVTLAHSLADLLDDNIPVVKSIADIADQPDVKNLRDIALHFNAERLATVIHTQAVPEAIAGATDEEKKKNFAITLQHKLFAAEPTAVLQLYIWENTMQIPTYQNKLN